MNEFEEIYDRIHGFDQKNEIINLWYEVTYLRFIISEILICNEQLKVPIDLLDAARTKSKNLVVEKFPSLGVKFTDIDQITDKSSDS